MQLAGLALLAVIAVTFAAFSISGAQTTPSQGASGPYIVPVSPFTANTPFSSGQLINVVVPANSLFISTSSVNIVECAAPNGVLPTLPNECDGNTIQGNTILPNSDGSINLQTQGYGLYQVFAVPDSLTLGESPSSAVTCGNTAATECVLYIGDAQGDFTQPHIFSEPFYVEANADDKGESPGDGSAPAVPLAPSATLSTVVASPTTVTADGTDQSTVTVTLLGTGNVPVPNKTVTLSQGAGQSTIIPTATPNMTDANGVATFTVTDSHVETVTYTAEDTTDSPPVAVSASATVDFEAPAVDAATSTVSSSIPSPVPSGQSDTITVTLRDQASNPQPVSGQTVTLTATGSVQITPQPAKGTTNSSGEATFDRDRHQRRNSAIHRCGHNGERHAGADQGDLRHPRRLTVRVDGGGRSPLCGSGHEHGNSGHQHHRDAVDHGWKSCKRNYRRLGGIESYRHHLYRDRRQRHGGLEHRDERKRGGHLRSDRHGIRDRQVHCDRYDG